MLTRSNIAACLGLRASEIVGLQWGDLNLEDLAFLVRRSVVHGRVGETKTEASRFPLPVDPRLADALRQQWRMWLCRGTGRNMRSLLTRGNVSCCHALMYLTCQPCAALASHVEKLWCCDGHPGVDGKDRALPDGRFQLAFSLAEGPISALAPADDGGGIAPSLLIGIRSRFSIIDTANLRAAMGVVFRPGGVYALLKTPADALRDKNVSLDLIWGSMVQNLRDRLRSANQPAEKFQILEVALLSRINEHVQLNAAVRYALQEFARNPQIPMVRELAHEAGLSRRRFGQLFREQIGLTPKLYCRLQRFQNALKQIASATSVDWAQLALTTGYCDQAHLAHEFRDFSGLSPSTYLANCHRPASHASSH